ncbi:MAG: tetratricopeptide repeat protein [Bacteroidetes bacterium]|nr:tetratricopeptide repeat protein [Bacteroidota bacterium]
MSKIKAKSQASRNWFETLLANPFNPYKIIFIACILLYAQILTFGLVHFDDHGFVLMAADTLKLSNIPQFFKHSVFWVLGDTTQDTDVFYRPLQNVIYAICNTIATKQAWIYHFMGLSFHVITSCVLFRFFRELKYHSSVALVFALIYSVHPVLVQGVAWIAGIGDQMATLFSLLSAIYFFKLFFDGKEFSAKYFILHFLFLMCALFSKEVSIALIPLCLFWIFFINKNKQHGKVLVATSISWIIITVAYFIFRANAIHPPKINLLASAFESFKVNGPLVFEYFEKMFLPYRLSPIPSREDSQLLVGLIVFVVIIFFLIYKKRFTPLDRNQNPTGFTRMSLFGALWFIVFLFPTFIQQNPQAHFFAFEHRLYLPLIGIAIIMMELFNIKQIDIHSNFQKYGFSLILILFFAITFSHSRTFTDPYTFYDKAISSSPKSVIAYNGFGKLLLEDKKYTEAIEAFKKSYEYKPDDLQTTGKIAEVYMKNLNNPQEAVVWFKKTLEIDSNSVEAAVSIGDAYWNFIHDTTNAILWYGNALKINPQNEFASANLGMIHASKGKNEEARKFLSQSLLSNPKNLVALKWISISYFNEEKISEAITYLSKAYEIYPNDVDLQMNLMICYYKLNDFPNTEKFASIYSKSNNKIPEAIEMYLKSVKR